MIDRFRIDYGISAEAYPEFPEAVSTVVNEAQTLLYHLGHT